MAPDLRAERTRLGGRGLAYWMVLIGVCARACGENGVLPCPITAPPMLMRIIDASTSDADAVAILPLVLKESSLTAESTRLRTSRLFSFSSVPKRRSVLRRRRYASTSTAPPSSNDSRATTATTWKTSTASASCREEFDSLSEPDTRGRPAERSGESGRAAIDVGKTLEPRSSELGDRRFSGPSRRLNRWSTRRMCSCSRAR